MAYDAHLDDFPACSSIPHAILNIQMVYCPHDQGYTLACMLGDESEQPWSRQVTRYGPFDDVGDVATDLAAYIRVMFRRRLLEGTLSQHALERRGINPQQHAEDRS